MIVPTSDKPVTTAGIVPGSRHTVTIKDVGFGGEGVARLDDFVIFVPFVMTGEVVEVEITEVKKKFARAKLARVVEASPERAQPLCRYYGDCGGCQYQHIEYSAQLRLKHKQICDLFERIGGFDSKVIAPVEATFRICRRSYVGPSAKLKVCVVPR